MKSSQFNPKEPLKQRRQEPSAIHARDIEPSKFGVSQSERPRFTHDDNYSIQPQSERVFEKFVVDPIRHNPAIIKQLSLEDEIDNFPTFPLNKRNNRVNTSLKSSELNDSHRKLNNSQILNSDIYVLDNVSEPELQNIIRKICEEAYELGAAGSERKALERLEKAEQLIRKHRIEDQFKQFELIFFIFHNMTAVSYNLSMLLEAQMYAEGSLANFEFLKKIRKPNRPYNFQLFSDQNEYILHRMKKMVAKKFICKTNLQLCIILSEFEKHKEAAQYAKRATRISCNLIIDTLILCYYILYKFQARKETNKPAEYYGSAKPGQNRTFEEQLGARKLVKNTMFDYSSGGQELDESMSSLNSKDSGLPGQRAASVDPNEDRVRKLIPILEEIVQRIKPQKYFSYWSKRDRILAYYREHFREMSWEEPDLGHLYAGIKEHAKLNTFNLLNIIKLTMISPAKISLEHPNFELELEPGNIFEKILLTVTGLYTISTETRFILNVKGLTTASIDLRSEKSHIEDWLSKSVEIGYMFLPRPLALMDQPEEEELSHDNKYLKTLRGGFRVESFIPIVRCKTHWFFFNANANQLLDANEEEMFKTLFTPQAPFLHERTAPEFETVDSRQTTTQEDFPAEENTTETNSQQGHAQSRGSEFRSISNENRKDNGFFRTFNQDKDSKRPNSENTYQSLRPSSKSSNTGKDYPMPKGPLQQQSGTKPQAGQKINNFFSNNTFSFDRTDNFFNLGPRVQTEDLDSELEPESLTQPDLAERSFSTSNSRSSNQKRPRQPSPFMPTSMNSDIGSRLMKSSGFKGVTEGPILQKEHQRPATSTKPRGNSPALQRKGPNDQAHLFKDTVKEGLLNKTVFVSTGGGGRAQFSSDHDAFARKALIKGYQKRTPPKFDIKINNNINFFINNPDAIEEIITGSVGSKPQERRQFKPQPILFEDVLLQKMQTAHKETERVKPRQPEIQRRAETDPDEHNSNSTFFPDFAEHFKIDSSKASKKRGKSPAAADNPFANSRMNRSVPKRANLSFSNESELDKSDFLNRSAIEQGRTRVAKKSAHSAERKPTTLILTPKTKQLTDLERLLRSTKPTIPNSKSQTPTKLVERALFHNKPYLNAIIKPTNNRLQETKIRKLDEILNRDQLAKNITKTRTKQNTDANDVSIGAIKNAHNEAMSLWDQMRANPKVFRTYDKS